MPPWRSLPRSAIGLPSEPNRRSAPLAFSNWIGLRKIRDQLLIAFGGIVDLADDFLVHAQLEQGLGRIGALRILADKRLQVGDPFFLQLGERGGIRVGIVLAEGVLGPHALEHGVGDQVVIRFGIGERFLQLLEPLDALRKIAGLNGYAQHIDQLPIPLLAVLLGASSASFCNAATRCSTLAAI